MNDILSSSWIISLLKENTKPQFSGRIFTQLLAKMNPFPVDKVKKVAIIEEQPKVYYFIKWPIPSKGYGQVDWVLISTILIIEYLTI